jgi:hypothetical protein
MGGAAHATPARTPAPGTSASRAAASDSARSSAGELRDARVSSVLSGKALYRMSDGRVIELPDDMTPEDAAKLEADAKKAQQKLGKGPGPKPVPQVKKPADKSEKKDAKKPAGKPGKGGARGKGGPKSPSRMAALKSFGGKVAKFLLGKAGPVLQRGVAKLRTLSKNEQTHDDAAKKVQLAEKAVVHPPSEGQSKSNAGQVQAVEARPAPPVDPAKGKATLQQSLSENVPKSIEDVDNFKRDMKGQHIGTDVLKTVQGDKNAVVGTFADMEKTQPPAPSEQVPENLPPPEGAPATGAMNLGAGAVAPLQPEHTDVSNFTKEGDAKLKEEGVTQEQLDMVDSGDLAAANKEKKGMEQMAKTEPLAIKQESQKQIAKVDNDLRNEEKKERGALNAKRKGGLAGANQKQKKAKSDLEKKRDEVAAKINGIHKAAQNKVKKKLADLETQSMKRFDDGNAVATKAFEDTVNREIDAFKDDRYSGVFGWARKAKDWLLGMDDLPEVKAIFDRNRLKFVTTIEKLVADIGADNKRVIQECKEDLAKARTEIKEYVDKLGPSLKDIGQKTAGDVSRQLDDMDKFIANKEEELQQKLADKQQAAIKAIDEKIEKMKDAMGGALAKLGKLLLLAAKKFFTWALEKFGYSLGEIQGIIDKGVAVLKAIFTKPIQFVKNLMSAAIQGFKNFGKNFLKHLKDALFEWLTGSMEGVKLPTSWDFMGIVGLVLQLVGITYANVRRHMVNELGEPAVVAMEKGFQLVKTLITEGPMAAWEQLKEMAGEMRDTFIEAVKDFIKTKIIEQAIIWIVSIFVPGAGIVKAIIGIYDTVVFFIQKAKQIMKMISNFLGSIGEIASGNIGAAATAMEMGLARGLSLVISFLAKLLRLDGITAKIKAAIGKVRAKVDGVLARIAKWIGKKAKALIGGIKKGAAKLASWWKKRRKFTAEGESHSLFFAGDARSAHLRVASDEKSLDDFLTEAAADKKKKPTVDTIRKLQQEIVKLRETRKPATPDAVAPGDDKIEENFEKIATLLPSLFAGDTWGTETNPVQLVYPKKATALYRTLYLGPRTTGGRLKQSDLQARVAKGGGKKAKGFDPAAPINANVPALDAWLAAGGSIQTYKPFSASSWPAGGPGGSLGVESRFQAQPGTSFKYEKGSTPGGKKINDALRKFGYFGRKDGGENSDGDHILEAQLVGRASADVIPNMWPLDKVENRHGKNLEENAEVSVNNRPTLKFKGLGDAVKSKDGKKTKRAELRVMIKSAKETT